MKTSHAVAYPLALFSLLLVFSAAHGQSELVGWTGTWAGPAFSDTVEISTEGGALTATFSSAERQTAGGWKNSNGHWTDCKVTEGWISGKTAECNWTVEYADDYKTGRRQGTLKMTLNGDKIDGEYVEGEASWFPKDKTVSVEAIKNETSMRPGKVWEVHIARVKQ